MIPAFFVHLFWWSYMVNNSELFSLFGGGTGDGSLAGYSSVAGYWASITMVFGSLVAGATSVGGGAVAFPVMTLVLDVAPAVARDFSMMIQTVGMVAATFTILYQQVRAPLSLPGTSRRFDRSGWVICADRGGLASHRLVHTRRCARLPAVARAHLAAPAAARREDGLRLDVVRLRHGALPPEPRPRSHDLQDHPRP